MFEKLATIFGKEITKGVAGKEYRQMTYEESLMIRSNHTALQLAAKAIDSEDAKTNIIMREIGRIDNEIADIKSVILKAMKKSAKKGGLNESEEPND